MKTLIKNGTVVTAIGRSSADVLIEGGKVVGMAAAGSHSWEEGADKVARRQREICDAWRGGCSHPYGTSVWWNICGGQL